MKRWLGTVALVAVCLAADGTAQDGTQSQARGPQVHVNAGNVAFRARRYAEAERLYVRALEQVEPTALPAEQAEKVYFNLGHARFQMGHWLEAIEAYRRSRAEDELQWIAQCNLSLGRLAEAALALRSLLVRFPERLAAREQLAQIYAMLGLHQQTLDVYLLLLAKKPDDARLQRFVATELLALGRTAEAIDRLEMAWRLGAREPQVARLLGDLYLQQGMYLEAAAYYSKHLALADNVGADDFFRVGYTYYSAAEYHSAGEFFGKAVELDSSYANGFLYLGNIARVEGELDLALTHFRTALRYDADLGAAHEAVASIELARNNLDAALAAFAEAIRCGHGSVSMYYNRVVTLIRGERKPEAILALKSALHAYPENARLLSLLTLLTRDLGM